LARSWAQGKSELIDDLAALVEGMLKGEFGPVEKGFLSEIGEMARSAAKGAARPTPAGAPPPAHVQAQTAAELARPPGLTIDELWARARARERQARLDELCRRNAQIPTGINMSWRRPGDDWW
jgi:hypothetical protein